MKKIMLIAIVFCLFITGLASAAGSTEGKKRIMVFGDSNTFGYVEDAQGVIDRLPLQTAWPGRMAELLGPEYEVVVEGRSGRTTRLDSPARSGTGIIPGAGMNGAAYLPAALSSHMPLDMVIIMLGTNDLRKDHNQSASDIAASLAELVRIVKKGEWQQRTRFAIPQVLVICPPKLHLTQSRYTAFFEGSLAKSEALPGLLRPLVEAAGAFFFDAATVVPFAQGPDEIHLTPQNHAALAEAVTQEVKKVFSNTDNNSQNITAGTSPRSTNTTYTK